MALTVIGVFDNASEARQAVDKLVDGGIMRQNIDLSLASDPAAEYGTSASNQYATTSTTRTDDDDTGSSIGNFFRSLFGDDDDDTDRYTKATERGSLVTVHVQTEDEAEKAADILDEAGAVDVNERTPVYDSLTSQPSASMGAAFTDTDQTNGDQTINVIEENLEIGKRTVETGGVRLRSRIIAKPVEESIRLREERVSVQRNPVNRPATDADLNAFQEGHIEVAEHKEVPVVSKTATVVEEISVGKDVTERDEVIRDTVRKTEVDVDDMTDSKKPRSDGDEVTYSTK
ncbi:YsnF/AvaK domain-containing protein [Spirosoma fluminis]